MGRPTSDASNFRPTSTSSTSSYLSPFEASIPHRPVPHANPSVDPRAPPPQSSANNHSSQPHSLFPSRNELPKIVWNLHPNVKIKLRKYFHPLGLTRLTLGADFDVHTHDLSFKWSWKDRIFGGHIEFFGNQIAITKRFNVDHRSNVDVRAAFDLQTRRTLFSFNIRPFWGVTANNGPPTGLRLKQRVPIDRHLALELGGKLTVPEARFSNETNTAVSLGEGDFIFDLEEMNFKLSLQ